MTRLFRPLLLALVAASVLAFAGATAANTPRAHAAGTCSVGSGRGYGYSYLTWLWTYKVELRDRPERGQVARARARLELPPQDPRQVAHAVRREGVVHGVAQAPGPVDLHAEHLIS